MRYNDDLPLSQRRAETELSRWRKRALEETRIKPNVIQRMSLADLKAEVARAVSEEEEIQHNREERKGYDDAVEGVFERFVTAKETVALLASGDYADLTVKQFCEKFPWFGIEEE